MTKTIGDLFGHLFEKYLKEDKTKWEKENTHKKDQLKENQEDGKDV